MTVATKIRARRNGDHTKILVMVKHPMQSTPDPQGNVRGAFIERMTFYQSGNLVAEAELGPGVAENPVTGISLSGVNQGEVIMVRWEDSEGRTGEAETTLK
jgi:hypothetical protein